MTKDPILKHPNLNYLFIIETDATDKDLELYKFNGTKVKPP